jgi:hypothetical protein
VLQARAEHSYLPGQRYFRFEKGRYVSSLPFPGLKVMQTAIKGFLSSVRSRWEKKEQKEKEKLQERNYIYGRALQSGFLRRWAYCIL